MNNSCGQLGAIQTHGTCWFYSILNGFILSDDGHKILYDKLIKYYKKLGKDEKAYFDDGLEAPCPLKNVAKTKVIYFWKFIDQYLCALGGPRAASLKVTKSAALLNQLSLQGTFAKAHKGAMGAQPQREIAKIIDHVGFKGDYYVHYLRQSKAFHALRRPQFIIVMEDKHAQGLYMDKIPGHLVNDSRYSLMCASITIGNSRASNAEMHKFHAVAGYVCNGKGYVYDSNQRKVWTCDWWDYAKLRKFVNGPFADFYSFFKNGQINYLSYAFAVFARKEFVKGIAPSCRLRPLKTPTNVYGINYTDPNLPKNLEKPVWNFLKPAQRAAIIRKWARTEHRAPVYINKATFNSILTGAKNRANAYQQVTNLESAGYKFKNENYDNFAIKLKAKFPLKKASPVKTNTFANVKARLNQYTKSTAAARKYQYSLVWRGLPMAQRKVLMHWRNKGVWLANNAFENKRKSVAKPKPKTPSPSPRTKRANQVRGEFALIWKGMNANNRQVVRNYIAAYKSPSPNTKKLEPFFAPVKYTLANAKRNVNALKTAKARKEFYKKGTVGKGLAPNNLVELSKYINAKNYEAMQIRRAKRAAKKSVKK